MTENKSSGRLWGKKARTLLPLPVIYAVCGILVAYLNSRFVTHDIIRVIGWVVAGAFLLVAALDLLGVRAG